MVSFCWLNKVQFTFTVSQFIGIRIQQQDLAFNYARTVPLQLSTIVACVVCKYTDDMHYVLTSTRNVENKQCMYANKY